MKRLTSDDTQKPRSWSEFERKETVLLVWSICGQFNVCPDVVNLIVYNFYTVLCCCHCGFYHPDVDRGLISGSNVSDEPTVSCAFEDAWITAMLSNRYKISSHVSDIFLAIDPSAGKDRNYYVLTSLVVIGDTHIVCLSFLLLLLVSA